MKAGKTAYLNEEDLWSLPPDDTAEALGTRLETAWQKRRDACKGKVGKSPSLTGALASAYGAPFYYAAIFKVSLRFPIGERLLMLSPFQINAVSSRLSLVHPTSTASKVTSFY